MFIEKQTTSSYIYTLGIGIISPTFLEYTRAKHSLRFRLHNIALHEAAGSTLGARLGLDVIELACIFILFLCCDLFL